jgi:hypothetical protein
VRRQHPERDDARYLELRRQGKTYQDIALLCGVSYETAWSGVQRARLRQRPARPAAVRPRLDLAITFGSSCKPLKLLTCADVHKGDMPLGTRCMCGVCHKSGVEDHPDLVRNPADDPAPEPKPKPAPKARPNRRQRRQQHRQQTAA